MAACHRRRSLFIVVAVAGAFGCASTRPSEFPTREELGSVAARPLPAKVFRAVESVAEDWELRDPLPEAFDPRPHAGDTLYDRALRDMAAARPGEIVASLAMHCAAQHTGRFLAERGKLPSNALARFIAARCGVPSSHMDTRTVSIDVAEDADASALAPLARATPKLLGEVVGAGAHDVGVAMVRGQKRSVVVALAQERQVVLRALSVVPDAEGKVRLRGEIVGRAASVQGYINRGAFGFARCAKTAGVRLPAFELTCEAEMTDVSAAVQLVAFQPGRILGDSVIDTIVFPAGPPSATFTRHAPIAGAPPSPQTLAEALNAKRAEAKLASVALDTPQTATAARMAPHFFASAYADDEEGRDVRDRIALGIMAGWDVQGAVSSGHVHSLVTPSQASAADVIDAALETPSLRAALFEPNIRRVAVGLLREQNGTGALFGAYELVDPSRHSKEAVRLLARIASGRAARSLPPAVVLPGLRTQATRAASQLEKGRDAEEVLEELSAGAVVEVRAAVRSYVSYGGTAEELQLPDELLGRPSLTFGLAVGHHRTPGHPWSRLAAVVVVAEAPDGGPRVLDARRGAARRF